MAYSGLITFLTCARSSAPVRPGRYTRPTAAREILEAALKLAGPTERAAFAAEILESLDSSAYGELSTGWEAEIQRTLDAFEAG